MNVLKVSVVEFQRNIGRYEKVALRQPVAVTQNGRDSTVLISTKEYERLKRRDREVLGLEDFTEADLAALKTSRPPPESMDFNHELK